MKSVVIEIVGRDAVLLNDNGTFTKAVNKKYQIGQRISVAVQISMMGRTMRWAVSAAAALLMLVGGTTFAYYSPYSYASVDINPSIEFRLNIFNRVISVNGVNSDGELLLQNVNLLDTNFSKAVKQIMQEAAVEGYIKLDTNNGIVIAVASNKDFVADEQAAEAKQQAEAALSEAGAQGEVIAERVGYDRVKEAQDLGITPGKLNLVDKYINLIGGSSSMDIKELASKPVGEIMKLIDETADKALPKSNPASDGRATGDTNDDSTNITQNGGDSTDNTNNDGASPDNINNGGAPTDNTNNDGASPDNINNGGDSTENTNNGDSSKDNTNGSETANNTQDDTNTNQKDDKTSTPPATNNGETANSQNNTNTDQNVDETQKPAASSKPAATSNDSNSSNSDGDNN